MNYANLDSYAAGTLQRQALTTPLSMASLRKDFPRKPQDGCAKSLVPCS